MAGMMAKERVKERAGMMAKERVKVRTEERVKERAGMMAKERVKVRTKMRAKMCGKRGWRYKATAAVLGAAMLLTACARPMTGAGADSEKAALTALSDNGYKLEQVVVLSRHNIRSPLSGAGSALGTITPHDWFAWSSGPSELSLRGGVLETVMGQYFRKWLEAEKLIPENYHPGEGEVRIYANAKQRTIATAQYFAAGMLPTANVEVEYNAEYDTMDPVFHPQITFCSEEYAADAEAQIREMYADTIAELQDNYELIAKVIDLKRSESFANGEITGFKTDDSVFRIAEGAEPAVSGSLKTACSVSDALVLQYYEESDDRKAGFGRKLSQKDWEDIAQIKDVYGDVLFTAPLVALNVANPLLKEIYSEMNTDGRKFTFLCGHDSNVGSVLAALGVSEYELPDAIEKKTPIGCKLVFSKWVNGSGEVFWSVDLMYQTVDQLRNISLMDQNDPPVIYHLCFEGLAQNADGLYSDKDIRRLFEERIGEYDSLYSEYMKKAA
ncbi:MAG: histidine-type phosphatase [Lachnospiraceae bacterium]|nr:histidine-type phosphatase [Lachnospiraceae bacterium]